MATIRELLVDLDVRFYERGEVSSSEGFLTVDCPHCGVPGKPGLGIHVRSLKCSCWRCGSHFIGHVLRDITGRPLHEIMRLLADLDQYIPNRDADRNPRAKYTPPADVGPLLPAHIRYLKNRRLDPDELAKVWGVAGIGVAARLQWTIFVPVCQNERPASWTTRALGPDVQPRYISASPDQEAVPIKSTIFGLDFVRNSAVVCEGPFDAMAIGRGAVSIFGLKWSHEQVLKLSRVPVRFICFDADPGAQQRAQKLAADLSLLPGCTHVIEIQSGKDPAECSDDEKTEIRKLLE